MLFYAWWAIIQFFYATVCIPCSNPSAVLSNITRESLAKQSDWQKQSVQEGKKYSMFTAEPKYRQDILCGAELCALHL